MEEKNLKLISIEKAMRSAKANVELEGLTVSPDMERLVKMNLIGDITDEEFNKEVLRMIKNRKNKFQPLKRGWNRIILQMVRIDSPLFPL
ncbi:antitoxin VbhA family protein [Rossellomorea aquimaris]|uniref:antitoxin VbhA family protein n=1 Tax=Rossellomorea aquimaris TaxID=189382 RepID=UPI0007D054B7|nr:antitoxin VbhA family protein [Rossellomorea aquimaris]